MISLSLMAFVLLLTVSVATLVQVESKSAQVQLETNEARLNAILGIQIALGDLQAAAGPDQRSVARADLMNQHSGVNVPRAAIPNTANNARRYWVGVSHSDGTSSIAPASSPVQAVKWLVSGLDDGAGPAAQLTSPFADAVVLIGENSVEPGDEVSAGRVVLEANGIETGAFAWIVDDETQKAKMVPSNSEVNNEDPSDLLNPQRNVLPGYYPLDNTTGLTTDSDTIFNAISLKDLVLSNSANDIIVRERFYDYTFSGYGILSDTRNGGLKRDLTAAFENPAVFDDLFPNTSATPYIAMDSDKFDDSPDLQSNGYINFGIFRDYYNLKDYLTNGALPVSVISKDLFYKFGNAETRDGIVGPHDINALGHPYGNFEVWSGEAQGNFNPSENYASNPITPSLAFFQQNAWVSLLSTTSPNYTYERNSQTWIGIYNPYNVRLSIDTQGSGLMVHGFPQGYLNLFESGTTNQLGESEQANLYNNERWVHATQPSLLEPGKTMMFGYADRVDLSDSDEDDSSWSQDIATASNASIFRGPRNLNQTGPDLPDVDMLVEFGFMDSGYPNSSRAFGGNMGWGLPYSPGNGNPNTTSGLFEIAQIFYFPFSIDFLTDTGALESVRQNKRYSDGTDIGSPGVKFLREGLTLNPGRMSELEEVFYNFKLRTSIEAGPRAIRPIIDSNIRAIWNNPKWDTDLGLNTIATHTFYDNESNSDKDRFPGPLDIDSPGASMPNGNGDVFQTVLFDIPRQPLVSIGQLQHAAAGRFSYEPSYIVGNSYANVRIPLDEWDNSNATDTYSSQHSGILEISGNFNLYDASYLVNEAIFDGYTFTTIPQGSSQAELDEFLVQEELLQNPRYIPYQPDGLLFDTANLQGVTAGRTNAGQVLVDGAFNVNSTSVEAWEVFLSGTKGLPFQKMNNNGLVDGFDAVNGVRFPRVQTVLGQSWQGSPVNESWFGFRALTRNEVRLLAEEIVQGIQARGPFYNLSEFINRSLVNGEEGKSGVLQTALDAAINSGIPVGFESPAATGSFNQIAIESTQGAGFSIQVLQGDILQSLAPFMQTRSDTFKIRCYGESSNPSTDEVSSRVWGEAVIQRLPDPIVDESSGTLQEELESATSVFGRKFKVVSFRWPTEGEV